MCDMVRQIMKDRSVMDNSSRPSRDDFVEAYGAHKVLNDLLQNFDEKMEQAKKQGVFSPDQS